MKNKIIFGFLLFFFLAAQTLLVAQSDYQIVQDFKTKMTQIEKSISGADSLSDLTPISASIDQLANDYASHKQLLDQSLYPDNFDRSISKLRNAFELRKADFAQIDVLHIQVTGLKDQVDTLTKHNSDLAAQFAALESQSKQDRSRLSQLEKLVSQLRNSLQQRDQIVMNMIDSLLPPAYTPGQNLSSTEKQQIISETEKNNVLYHIRKAVTDNIRFLEDTKLMPDDITKVRQQEQRFLSIWRSVGPTMVSVYSEKGKSTNQLKDIDEAFNNWDNKINQEVWESINDNFSEHNITLGTFSNGKEFTNSVVSYIDGEISKAQVIEDKDAQAAYKSFVDSTWSKNIEPTWMPFLLKNQMISDAQKDTIDVKIAAWGKAVYPHGFPWIYVIAGIIIIAVIVLLIIRRSPRKISNSTVAEQRTR